MAVTNSNLSTSFKICQVLGSEVNTVISHYEQLSGFIQVQRLNMDLIIMYDSPREAQMVLFYINKGNNKTTSWSIF
jgi:hypothetical protein